MKVNVPSSAFRGFDDAGRRYLARAGKVEVPDELGRRLLRHGECFPVADAPKVSGRVCQSCGFHGYFRVCGRCQGTCVKPGENGDADAPPQE